VAYPCHARRRDAGTLGAGVHGPSRPGQGAQGHDDHLIQLRRSLSSSGCQDCPPAEELPPKPDYWKIRTSNQDVMDVAAIKKQITYVQQHGGGWLPLVFHHIGTGKEAITPAHFKQLVDWVAHKPEIRVYSMDRVIGGIHRPVLGQVIDRWSNINPANPVPVNNAHKVPPPEQRYAFQLGLIKIGQGAVIATGLVLALGSVIGWRFHTRNQRYRSSNPRGSS
jgi:hypothetical protein